ncbi:PilZ domain-containing protein [Paenibacillus sp. GYB003]|uniref:PilZ domain-containing protein n=1 Tax=Paenibacillus sp. GYB003 TaxID=2994392 RepID=UPI002F9631C5
MKRRAHFRIHLPAPIRTVATLLCIGSVFAANCHFPINVHDIGPGGMRISSPLNFPVETGCIIKIPELWEEALLSFHGVMVWSRNEADIWQYGIRFLIGELRREALKGQLIRLAYMSQSNVGVAVRVYRNHARTISLENLEEPLWNWN